MNLGGTMNNRTWIILGLILVVTALAIAVYVSQRGPEASILAPATIPLPNDDGEVVTAQGSPVTINVLNNDTQISSASVISISENPQNGAVTINPDQTHTYTPNANFTGTDSYSYQICNNAQCSLAKVTINVTPSNPLAITQGQGVISGSTFYDINENGQFEANELGLANWTVYLDLNNNAILDDAEPRATTNEIGGYAFNLLPASTYTIRVVDQDT